MLWLEEYKHPGVCELDLKDPEYFLQAIQEQRNAPDSELLHEYVAGSDLVRDPHIFVANLSIRLTPGSWFGSRESVPTLMV
jgi:hypothetical protein